jgi:hypothetical protein
MSTASCRQHRSKDSCRGRAERRRGAGRRSLESELARLGRLDRDPRANRLAAATLAGRSRSAPGRACPLVEYAASQPSRGSRWWPTIMVEDEPGKLLGRALRARLEPLRANAELGSELSKRLDRGRARSGFDPADVGVGDAGLREVSLRETKALSPLPQSCSDCGRCAIGRSCHRAGELSFDTELQNGRIV